jgi:hypothetical protein
LSIFQIKGRNKVNIVGVTACICQLRNLTPRNDIQR